MKPESTVALCLAALCLAAVSACGRKPAESAAPPAAFGALQCPAQKPEGAVGITAVRQKAKPGDTITVYGEVGGRKVGSINPGLAAFFLTDYDVVSNCVIEHGEGGCPTPWDYCCAPAEKLRAALAFVQVKTPGGQVVPQTLRGWNGLTELTKVIVRGTVDAVSTPDALIINAEAIYIQPVTTK